MPELSVVLPVYNEEGSLERLLAEVEPVTRDITTEYEIVFVNDGSTDGSGALMARFAADNPRIRVIELDRNHGLSSALHAGFHAARAPLLATMDADLQNDPKDMPKLVQAVRDGADMACGWRRDREDPWIKRVSSRIANGWRNWRTGASVHDATCPLKVMRREVLEVFHPFDGMHRFLPTLVAMKGYRVVEIPVSHRPRLHGTSKYGVWNRLFRGLRDLKAVKWMQSRQMTYRVKDPDA